MKLGKIIGLFGFMLLLCTPVFAQNIRDIDFEDLSSEQVDHQFISGGNVAKGQLTYGVDVGGTGANITLGTESEGGFDNQFLRIRGTSDEIQKMPRVMFTGNLALDQPFVFEQRIRFTNIDQGTGNYVTAISSNGDVRHFMRFLYRADGMQPAVMQNINQELFQSSVRMAFDQWHIVQIVITNMTAEQLTFDVYINGEKLVNASGNPMQSSTIDCIGPVSTLYSTRFCKELDLDDIKVYSISDIEITNIYATINGNNIPVTNNNVPRNSSALCLEFNMPLKQENFGEVALTVDGVIVNEQGTYENGLYKIELPTLGYNKQFALDFSQLDFLGKTLESPIITFCTKTLATVDLTNQAGEILDEIQGGIDVYLNLKVDNGQGNGIGESVACLGVIGLYEKTSFGPCRLVKLEAIQLNISAATQGEDISKFVTIPQTGQFQVIGQAWGTDFSAIGMPKILE